MGDSEPFSILNERLRPRFTAMERLCYSLDTLNEGLIKRPDRVGGPLTTHPAILREEPETLDNLKSTRAGPDDATERERVITEGLSHTINSGDDDLEQFTLAMSLMPSLNIELATPDGGELPAVSESVENDGPAGLSTVREADGSEATSKDSSPSRWSRGDGTLPDVIRGGRQLNRRRTLGPVSDTLNEVRREVELSRRRSLRLKAQVDKLQENRDGSGWSQQRERVTQEIQCVLKLLLPLANEESSLVQPSGQEISLDTSLVLLQNVARKLALNHTEQDSKSGVQIENGVVDCAVLQQALCDRDEALEKKKAMEAELLRSKTDMMLLNNQLLEAVQKRLELAVELETWKDDVQLILQHQLQSQQQQAAEEAQRKPSRLGLLRRTNKPPIQKPASSPGPAPSPPRTTANWKDRLKRGKGSKASSHGDQNAAPALLSPSGRGQDDGFQNIDL